MALFKGKDYSEENVGNAIGQIENTFIQENKFLQFITDKELVDNEQRIDKVIFNFLKGFFNGLKRSKTKCQCFEDIMKLRPIFLQRIDEFIKEIQSGLNFYSSFKKMLQALITDLSSAKKPCRYNYLIIALEKTWSQIIDSLIVNSRKISLHIVEAFKLNDAEKVGKGLGKIFDIIYDFYVY